MDQPAVEIVTKALLADIRSKLEDAASIAVAADKFADLGNIQRAVRTLIDFEDLAYQAQELFKAALLINRISKHD